MAREAEKSQRPDYFVESGVVFTGEGLPWRWEEDGMTVTRSAAWSGPGCHDGCGVLIYSKDGKLVKVEGDPENPYSRGRLCARCLALPEVTYHPDRLTYPMKRVGKRGEDKWERISWDEAYDTIAEKFIQFREESGPESVVFAQGTGRDILAYITSLAYSYGSPNYAYFLSGAACYVPRIAASYSLMGTYTVPDCSQYFIDRYDNPDWKPPACIFVWGNNPIVANADGNLGHWIVDCMKRGSKLVVVDPRLTWLAAQADLWLQIRPGTDAALALSMIDIIAKEGLYDKEFVDNWTYGFEQLAERAAEYPVEKASEITWIPEEKIRKAAHMMAEEKPTSVQWGLAIDMTREAVPGAHAICALWSITGNIDVPGGMITAHPPFNTNCWSPPDPMEYLPEDVCEKRIGFEEYPMYKYGGCVFAQNEMLVDTMLSEEPYKIRGTWLQTTNPLACTAMEPDTRMLPALLGSEFNVVVDLFMTPTAMAVADIVLPAATYPERDGIRGIWYYLQTINKAIDNVGDTKSDIEINMEMGKRLNPEFWEPFETPADFVSYLVEDSGMKFDDLRKNNWTYPEYGYYKYRDGKQRGDGEPGFMTPTGRIELYSTLFEMWGLDPLPYFEEPDQSPLNTPELLDEFPLVLTTGARNWSFFHSEHRQIPHLRAMRPDPLVEIHPETAAKLGIIAGDWVVVENQTGKVRMRAKLTEGIDPKVVNCDHAWWFPEKDPEDLYGVFESNVNKLAPAVCGRSGFGANVKALLCKVYKEEGEM